MMYKSQKNPRIIRCNILLATFMLSNRLQRWRESFFYVREYPRKLLSVIKCRGQDYFLEGFKGEKDNEYRHSLAPNPCFVI